MAPVIVYNMEQQDLCFQALTYDSGDEEDRFFIRIFGKTREGQSVCIKTAFTPHFFIEIKPGQSKEAILYKIKDKLSKTFNRDAEEDDEDNPQYINLRSHLVDTSTVERMKYWGFENHQKKKFVRLVFTTEKAMQRASWIADKAGYMRYEANIAPVLRFMHVRNLQSTGWVRVPAGWRRTSNKFQQTTCDIEGTCAYTTIDPLPEMSGSSAPFVLASWDIEAMSSTGGFPNPSLREDVVFQVATTFQRYGASEPHLKHLINLGTCDPIHGVELVCVQREADIFTEFVKVLRRENVDVIIGFNIYGFDFEYLWNRAQLSVSRSKLQLGRLLTKRPELVEMSLSSAAYGQNKFKVIPTPGVFQVDLYVWAKREVKMDSGTYKLDSLAEHFLGQRKLDVTPQEIFKLYTQGPQERRRIGEYCVQVGPRMKLV